VPTKGGVYGHLPSQVLLPLFLFLMRNSSKRVVGNIFTRRKEVMLWLINSKSPVNGKLLIMLYSSALVKPITTNFYLLHCSIFFYLVLIKSPWENVGCVYWKTKKILFFADKLALSFLPSKRIVINVIFTWYLRDKRK